MPPEQLDALESIEPVAENAVDERLDEAVAPGPAELHLGRRHPGELSTALVDVDDQLVRNDVLEDLVDETDRLEHAQRFVVHADAARVVDQVLAALDERHANAVQAEHVRERQPTGPGADDRDIEVALAALTGPPAPGSGTRAAAGTQSAAH